MDQAESSRSSSTYGNSGRHYVFHTNHLCEKLVLPRGHFDLTDPNGYKLSTTYNCLHDPYLKNYMYRKDIHKHLLEDGFITKHDRVTCNLKEFRTYKNYLRELQLELDQRFKMEQRALVRRILLIQQEGRISSDISVPDFIEYLHTHGQELQRKDADRPRRTQSSGNGKLKRAKGNRRLRPLYTDEEDRMRWRSMVEEVTHEVQREMRLERRWRGARQNWYESHASLRARVLGDDFRGSGSTPLSQGHAGQPAVLMRRPTLKRLSPLPRRKRKSAVESVYCNGRMSWPGQGDKYRLKSRDNARTRSNTAIPIPPVTAKTSFLSKHEGSYGDSSSALSMPQRSEQMLNHEKNKIHNAMEDHPEETPVNVMISGMVSTIVPVMQQFMQKHLPAPQTGSTDKTTTHHHHHHHDHVSRTEVTQCDGDIDQHLRSDTEAPQSSPDPIHQPNEETVKSEKAQSLSGGESGPQDDLRQKAERVIWHATHEVMKHIKARGSSSSAADDEVESDSGHSVSNERCCAFQSTTASTQEGCCAGERACTSSFTQLPDSLANSKTQRGNAEACGEHPCVNAAPARNTQQGNTCCNQEESPKLKHFSTECKLSGTTLRNLVYAESVDDILEKISTLVAEEAIEAISKTNTNRSSSAVSSATLSSSTSASSARIKRIVEDCVLAGWKEHNESAQRGASASTSASTKLPVGPTVRSLSDIAQAPKEEFALYADDMVMDIIDQMRNQRSPETEYSGTPYSFSTSKRSSENLSVHDEAVKISHQIFLDMKGQLDRLHFSNSDACEEKAILCEYVDMALDKLSNMCAPKWQFLTQAAEMKSSVTERSRSRGCESLQHEEESLKTASVMENVKMQFEKAAQQPVKAALECALHSFNPTKCDSSKNALTCQNDLRVTDDDLSSLTSDIVMIIWQSLIDASCRGAPYDCHGWEAKLSKLIKAICDVSSSVYNNNAIHASPITLKAELVLQSINLDIETKLAQFITNQSEGDQKPTGIASLARDTASVDRSARDTTSVHRCVGGIQNVCSEPVTVFGQELPDSVVASSSEHTYKDRRDHSIFAKKTHSRFQLTQPLNAHISNAVIPETRSKSAGPLITDTCGDQMENLKIKKEGNMYLADPTFNEKTPPGPNTNRGDLCVQRFTVEELSPLCLASLSASLSNWRCHGSSMQTPYEGFYPEFTEQLTDAVGSGNIFACCSPARMCLIKLTIGTLVSKVIDKCMLGSEFLTERGLLSSGTTVSPRRSRLRTATTRSSGPQTVSPRRSRPQSATSGNERRNVTAYKSGMDGRPYSADADLGGVEHICQPRSSIARHVVCSSQELHSSRRSQTQACSVSGTLLNPLSMFWKNFRKSQPAVTPAAADGPGVVLSPSKASAVPQQGNGDKVKTPSPAPCTDKAIIPQPGPVKDILINLWVHIHSDESTTPGAAFSSLDSDTLKHFDSLLPQLEVFWHDLLRAEGVEHLPSRYINEEQVAWSIYQDLAFNYCCSREELCRAIAAPEEQLVARLVTSLGQSLTHCIRSMKNDPAYSRPSSFASSRLSSPSSWVTEEACTISEDVTLRSVDLISPCSVELAEDLMDAVMVELCTDPERFGSPEAEMPSQDWPQLSLVELNQAATEVYKYMLEQCGSLENLQSALRSREKQVVTNMAVAIATQTYNIISMKDTSDAHVRARSETPVNESRATPVNESRATPVNESRVTPVPSQPSNLSGSVSIGSSPQPTPGQCSIFYQTVWDIVSTLMLEVCKKKAHRQHLTPKLFLRVLATLSECPGVNISNDKKLCDVSDGGCDAIERVVLAARRRLSDYAEGRRGLESLLAAKDEAAMERVVLTLVEEMLTFASHPFGVVTVSEAEVEMTQSLPHDLKLCPSMDVLDAGLHRACQHHGDSEVCSLCADMPGMAMSMDMSPEPTTSKSHMSNAEGSKKVKFLPSTKVDYFKLTKSERKPKLADEAEHPVHLKNRKVISIKVKKHSSKGKAPGPRRPKSHQDDQSVQSEESNQESRRGLGTFLTQLFHRK
ncbi:uncharacterized protein LOC134449210 [Engraulis encrasicolus]|uniref:uncharacterized protein LOC134449210 n=1 Tax=Engraulis encrasicolus TaxID=184585 RepID=UPI002FD37DE8